MRKSKQAEFHHYLTRKVVPAHGTSEPHKKCSQTLGRDLRRVWDRQPSGTERLAASIPLMGNIYLVCTFPRSRGCVDRVRWTSVDGGALGDGFPVHTG